jgi:hypothetical protein
MLNFSRSPPTSGKQWFDVPNTPLTPELEKTFQLLQLRPYLYKDRHYKRTATSETPEFFAVGTVLDDAKDYYTTRVHKKQRKQSLVDEILGDEDVARFVSRKAQVIKDKADVLKKVRQRKNGAKMRPKLQWKKK